MHPLMPGLDDGAIVRLMPSMNRIMNKHGQFVQRPEIGVELSYQSEGSLTFRTGRIAVGDPMLGTGSILATSVPAGTYETWSVLAKTATQTRIAAAVVRFNDAPATKRVVAAFQGEDPSDLDLDTIGGVGIDSGAVCIGEPIDPQADSDLFQTVLDRGRETLSRDIRYAQTSDLAFGTHAFWKTGYGDGMYTPYLGLAADGRPCYFAVEFGIIANALRGPAVQWPSVGDSFDLVPVPPAPWYRRVLARLGLG
jgi:hypothetical protein